MKKKENLTKNSIGASVAIRLLKKTRTKQNKVIAILGCTPTSLGEGGTGSDHKGGPRLLLRGTLITWCASGRKAKMLKKVYIYTCRTKDLGRGMSVVFDI